MISESCHGQPAVVDYIYVHYYYYYCYYAHTKLVFHLDLRPFDFPLVRLWGQTKDSRFVALWYWVLEVGDETSCLL